MVGTQGAEQARVGSLWLVTSAYGDVSVGVIIESVKTEDQKGYRVVLSVSGTPLVGFLRDGVNAGGIEGLPTHITSTVAVGVPFASQLLLAALDGTRSQADTVEALTRLSGALPVFDAFPSRPLGSFIRDYAPCVSDVVLLVREVADASGTLTVGSEGIGVSLGVILAVPSSPALPLMSVRESDNPIIVGVNGGTVCIHEVKRLIRLVDRGDRHCLVARAENARVEAAGFEGDRYPILPIRTEPFVNFA